MLRSLLIDNYDSYTYNLFQLLAEASGVPPLVFKNDEISLKDIVSLVEAGEVRNVVISPGPGTPHSPHDIGVCLDVLRHLPYVPVLGVCLGHQALAAAHGAHVIKAPEPVHGRLSELQHSSHPLLHQIPSGPQQGFDTVRYHSLIVDAQSLPPCLEPIAWTCGSHHAVCLAHQPSSGKFAASPLDGSQAAAHGQDQTASSLPVLPAEPPSFLAPPFLSSSLAPAGKSHQPLVQQPNPQIIMGLAHRSQPHFGVQFHPESISTRFGCVLLSNFLRITAAHLQLEQPLRLLPAGPEAPGRKFPPKPWPTADFLEGMAPLQLVWERLEGLLAPGGPRNTERLFSHLFEWAPCSFWLDSATSDRGRFSYMGGKGGPLWKHITYHLPPVSPSQPASPSPPPAVPTMNGNSSPAASVPAANLHQETYSGVNARGTEPYSNAAAPVGTSACSTGSLPANGDFSPARTQCAPSSSNGGNCVSGIVEVEDATGGRSRHSSSFFDFLSHFVGEHRLGITPEAASQLPFDFWCGLVGYLGFELKAECGGARAHKSPTHDASMFFVDRMVAVDQLQGDVYVLAIHEREQQQQQQQQQQEKQDPRRQLDEQQQQQQQQQQEQGEQYPRKKLRQQQHHQHKQQQDSQQQQQQQQHIQMQDSQQQHSSSHHHPPKQQAPNSTAGHQDTGVPGSAAHKDIHNNGLLPCSSYAGAADTTTTTANTTPVQTPLQAPPPVPTTTSANTTTANTTTSATTAQPSNSSKAHALAWVHSTMQQLKLLAKGPSSTTSPCGSKGSDHHHPPSLSAVPTGTTSIPNQQEGTVSGSRPANAMASSLGNIQTPVDKDTLVSKDKLVTKDTSGKGFEGGVRQPPAFHLRHSRQQYMDNVRACKKALYEGESYEVCLTTALQRRGVPDSRRLYHTLRTLNPAPYAAWLQCGLSGPTICCSSPERFMRGGRGGVLEARPIKGTAPRVKGDATADAAAAAALASSEKDRAENLMIVDLIRNDLGRVCEVGSVHVPDLMEIESYATVHQMVSTVRGVRRAQASAVDCIRAAFPGGSMTGAPKIRTMEIIDTLEGAARGVYSGCIGFISLNDTFDLNIVIRTAVVHPTQRHQRQQQQLQQQLQQQQQQQQQPVGHEDPQQQQQQQAHSHLQQASSMTNPDGFSEGAMMSIGAGGAIVVQSGIEEEYEEMRLKARALLSAVGRCDAECAYGNGEPAKVEDECVQML